MNETIKELQEKFEKINQKGYIKGIYNSNSSVGRTFELELGLSENSKSMPDYNGIEIKTKKKYSKSLIALFNAFPDGREKNELLRLRDQYGYPHKKDKQYKCLYVEAYGNKLNKCGLKFLYKLEIDNQKKRIYLNIYNQAKELIEKKVYWSFEYLNKKLTNKLKCLALVHANSKRINSWEYFEYYNISFYVLKNFQKFLNLIRDGKISMYMEINVRLTKSNYGQVHYNGCAFRIDENNLPELFYKYDIKTKRLK